MRRVRWWVVLPLLLVRVATAADPERRPVVAVVGENDGTEITDFVVPYGVLAAADVAEVITVAVHAGPVRLMPAALTIVPDATIAAFDARHPEGADYVIVPAVHAADDPDLRRWLRAQAELRAVIASICDGAWVVAGAGLLDDRAATAHWFSTASLARQYPRTHVTRDRRWVRDGPILTTTGVSAALPASLALVAEIAGPERARAVADALGVAAWDDGHVSARFALDRAHVLTAATNWLAFWRWERVAIPVAAGVDEIALAFTADAFARTYRSTPVVTAVPAGPIVTRRGLTLLVDDGPPAADRTVTLTEAEPSARALPRVLAAIDAAYGSATARFVALQLEYAWGPSARP